MAESIRERDTAAMKTHLNMFMILLLALAAGVACSEASSLSDGHGGDVDAGLGSEAGANDPIADGCDEDDGFVFTDLGKALGATDIGEPADAPVADPSPILTLDGRVRLYFLAGGAPHLGVWSAISDDGIRFEPEGQRVSGQQISASPPLGHPRVVRLDDDRIRMLVVTGDGFGSLVSEDDGLSFEEEPGIRIDKALLGAPKLIKLTPVRRPDGSWRGYFSTDSLQQPPEPRQIYSATSPDLLTWTLDEGQRLGEDAPHLLASVREPFAIGRAGDCVTLFYVSEAHREGIAYSTASDGLTFKDEQVLPTGDRSAGPALLRLGDGSYLFYHDATTDELGHHMRVGRLSID